MRNQLLFVGLIAAFAAAHSTEAQIQMPLHLVSIPDDQLGSKMTLEQLQKGTAAARGQKLGSILSVQPAAELVPALKYKLYPSKWELKSGSALLHLNRALIHWLQLPREKRIQWQSAEWLNGAGDREKPSQQQMEKVVTQLNFLFAELHELAMCEDFQWDHRLRDVTGANVYTYLLPDIQEVRSLARMLKLRIRVQLANKDFDGAISSISDGIRLAEFVGQGETLIQKLVGIAIQGMMREKLKDLIGTAGSPNMYWAMATIPRPLNRISDSVMWELGSVFRVFPVLQDADSQVWSAQQATARWKSMIDDFSILDSATDDTAARTAIAMIGATQVQSAKNSLRRAGMSEEFVDQIPGLQAVLIHTSRELKALSDDLGKCHLLPSLQARQLAERQSEAFQEYLRKNRLSSLAAIIARVLYPAVQQAAEAEVRMEMTFHRLMTLEAIRMYVAENNKLPDSLLQLAPVPAFLDPYTGEPFQYLIEESDAGPVVTLKSAGPASYTQLMVLQARFESLK